MVDIYIYIMHYVLTTVLDKLDIKNNFWDVTFAVPKPSFDWLYKQ